MLHQSTGDHFCFCHPRRWKIQTRRKKARAVIYVKFLLEHVKWKTYATDFLFFFGPGNDFITSRSFKMAGLMKTSCWQQNLQLSFLIACIMCMKWMETWPCSLLSCCDEGAEAAWGVDRAIWVVLFVWGNALLWAQVAVRESVPAQG